MADDTDAKTMQFRAIAAALFLIPIILGFSVAWPLFWIVLPFALAGAGLMESQLGLPKVRKGCFVAIAICPILAQLFFNGLPFGAFFLLAVIAAIAAALLYFAPTLVKRFSSKGKPAGRPISLSALTPSTAPTSEPSQTVEAKPADGTALPEPTLVKRDGRVVMNQEYAMDGVPPLIATAVERATTEGVEYEVTWTDFAKLNFWDRYYLLFVLPGLAFFMWTYAPFSYGFGSSHDFYLALCWIATAAGVGIWIYKAWHERDRYSVRSITFSPNGSIFVRNPPSYNPNYATEGPSIVIADGVSRLTSIEYTKTADWSWTIPQCVRSVEHWYDVNLFLGEEWRVAVSRNLGSRDHAHQVNGHLNKLKARLTRPRPAPMQSQARVLD